MTIQYRTSTPTLGVETEGRTIYGIAVPYNAPTRIDDRLIESFSPGAFSDQMREPEKVKFARNHMDLGGELIGAAKVLRDDPGGLYVELRTSRTKLGDETLELVRDRALTHMSIAFTARQSRRLPGGITERTNAYLREVAMVVEGAYGDLAAADGVRSRIGQQLDAEDQELRANAEQYLTGIALPSLRDYDTERRAILLGINF